MTLAEVQVNWSVILMDRLGPDDLQRWEIVAVCGLSLNQGNTESRKTLEQKFTFQIGTLNPDGINERFSFN